MRWPICTLGIASRDQLGAPTEAEISQITEGLPAIERERFMRASSSIAGAKIRSGDRTPWRELIRLFRLGDPVRVEVEVIDIDGQQRVQTIIAERGFGLKGDDALMFGAISELSDALNKIESFEPDHYVSHGVENLALIKRQKVVGALGGRPEINREQIRACLNRSIEKHGLKKIMDSPISWIIDRVIYAWQESHDTALRPPANNTIRTFIEEALPEHPVVKKKKSKKPGC